MTPHLSYEIIFHVGGLKLAEIDTMSPGLKVTLFLSLITEIASLWPAFLCPSAKVKCQLIISATQNVKGNDFSSSMPHHVAIVSGKSSQRLQDISAFHIQNLSRDLQMILLYAEAAWRRYFKTTVNYFSTLRLMRSSFLLSRISKISNLFCDFLLSNPVTL